MKKIITAISIIALTGCGVSVDIAQDDEINNDNTEIISIEEAPVAPETPNPESTLSGFTAQANTGGTVEVQKSSGFTLQQRVENLLVSTSNTGVALSGTGETATTNTGEALEVKPIEPAKPKVKQFTLYELNQYDGEQKKQTYIGYEGNIYEIKNFNKNPLFSELYAGQAYFRSDLSPDTIKAIQASEKIGALVN